MSQLGNRDMNRILPIRVGGGGRPPTLLYTTRLCYGLTGRAICPNSMLHAAKLGYEMSREHGSHVAE
jgi:hypothetical protein